MQFCDMSAFPPVAFNNATRKNNPATKCEKQRHPQPLCTPVQDVSSKKGIQSSPSTASPYAVCTCINNLFLDPLFFHDLC